MKTHLKKLTLIGAACAALASTSYAQKLIVRGEAGLATMGSGTYETAGAGGSVSFGSTLDAAEHHEITVSFGAIAWGEPEVRGYRPDDALGTTKVRIDGDYYDLPTSNEHFTIDGKYLVLSNGSKIDADYRPSLAIVPIMAHYRLNLGETDSRVRFFIGAGAGFARMRMESELWKEFKRSTGARTQSDTASSFTWSGTAGISVRLFKGLKAEASYVYQSIKGTDFRMDNVTCNLDRMDIHQLRGGVSWAF